MAPSDEPIRPAQHPASGHGPITPDSLSGSLVSRIESLLESVVDGLSNTCEVSIPFKSRRAAPSRSTQSSTASASNVCFPGKSRQEARKFSRRPTLPNIMDDLKGIDWIWTILTKRHIYYQHQELFEKQKIVDELVDDLAFTLEVNRDDLNIVAASKGVMSGPLTILLQDGTQINAATGSLGTPIPEQRSFLSVHLNNVKWILVIEKEAVFRSLTSSHFWQSSAAGPGILLTAKGYPDMITLSFLRFMRQQYPHLPILALVDFDPDGLNILRCYRCGGYNVPGRSDDVTIQWLGIRAPHVVEAGTVSPDLTPQWDEEHNSQSSARSATSRTSMSSTNSRDPISRLTGRDRKLAASMLDRIHPLSTTDTEAALVRNELQVMLMMGIKAEIQWLDDSGDITEWLDRELRTVLAGRS